MHTLSNYNDTGIFIVTPEGDLPSSQQALNSNFKTLVTTISTGYVPYTGANTTPNLGTHGLILDSNAIQIGSEATSNGPGSAQFGGEWLVEIEPSAYPGIMLSVANTIAFYGSGAVILANNNFSMDEHGNLLTPLPIWSDINVPFSQLIIDGGMVTGNWVDTSIYGYAGDDYYGPRFYLYWNGTNWEIEDTNYTDGIIGFNGSSLVANGGTNSNDPTDGSYVDGGNNYFDVSSFSLLIDHTTFGKLDTQSWILHDPFIGGNPNLPDPGSFSYGASGSGVNTWTIDQQGNFSGNAATASSASGLSIGEPGPGAIQSNVVSGRTTLDFFDARLALATGFSELDYPLTVLTPSGLDASLAEMVCVPNASGTLNVIAKAGNIYFDTGTNHFYGYDGSSWKQLDN